MSDATRRERSTLNRRQLLQLSTAAGLGAAAPHAASEAAQRGADAASAAGSAASPVTCSTPRTAMAKTQYGKVRGYVEDGVLTFKGVPYGAMTGGENRWLPAKPPAAWDGEYPALIYGANCPQRLHDWVAEQTFLYQWTDGWQSEDMLKVNIWTPSLTGSRPVMFYLHGGGFTCGSAYELASQDGAQMARHHDVVSVTVNHRLNLLGARSRFVSRLARRGTRSIRLVARSGLTLGAVGVMIGLIAAVGLSRVLEGTLFGISALDPQTYAIVAGVLLAVVGVASSLPAWRASRVAAMAALRSE